MQIINQPVILSGVELSPSEERGESAKRRAICGILQGVSVAFQRKSYICCGKPLKLVKRSHRRYRSLVFPRSSLEKTSTSVGAHAFLRSG